MFELSSPHISLTVSNPIVCKSIYSVVNTLGQGKTIIVFVKLVFFAAICEVPEIYTRC